MNELKHQLYALVQIIPKGFVTTYGDLAKILNVHDTRQIGWLLHQNQNPLVPCHRVVTKDGRIAQNFAFNGEIEQRLRLENEGVSFIDDNHVNMNAHHYDSQKIIQSQFSL